MKFVKAPESFSKFSLKFQNKNRLKILKLQQMLAFYNFPSKKTHSSFILMFFFFLIFALTMVLHELMETNLKNKLGGMLI